MKLKEKLYEKKQQKAIAKAKKRIQFYIACIKANGYRELTREEQFALGEFTPDDWFGAERILLIKDHSEENGCWYILSINLWHPSVITYYMHDEDVQKAFNAKEDHFEVPKHLCTLLYWEVKWVYRILEEYYRLGDTFFRYEDFRKARESILEKKS